METQGTRGQCAVELVLVLIALTSVILITQQLAELARGFYTDAYLSRERRP